MNRQEHLLVCLAEECSEVIKEVSKCLRFGYDDRHPDLLETNVKRLYIELCDVMSVVYMLQEEEVLQSRPIWNLQKIEKVEKYIEYAKEREALC